MEDCRIEPDYNPYIEEMKEKGWAFVHTSIGIDRYGSPHTSHGRAEASQKRYEKQDPKKQEVHIISWE